MVMPPEHVIAAARVVADWAAENDLKSWRIGALASRDEMERTAARYAVARELGTEVWYEAWAGMRRRKVTLAEFDAVVDARVRASQLSFGEVIELARGATA